MAGVLTFGHLRSSKKSGKGQQARSETGPENKEPGTERRSPIPDSTPPRIDPEAPMMSSRYC